MGKRRSLAEIMKEEEARYGASEPTDTSREESAPLAVVDQGNSTNISITKNETEILNEALAEVLIDKQEDEPTMLSEESVIHARRQEAAKTTKRKLQKRKSKSSY